MKTNDVVMAGQNRIRLHLTLTEGLQVLAFLLAAIAAPTPAHAAPSNALVVSDAATMRRIVRDDLGQTGNMNILEANDIASALSIISQNNVYAVVADWVIQPKPAACTQFLQSVRSNVAIKNTVILVFTANDIDGKVAISAGATDYILKPFSAANLQAKLNAIGGGVR